LLTIDKGFNPRISNLWREVTADAQIPQGQDMAPLNVHAGDRLWISFKNANLDVSFTRMILENVFLKNDRDAACPIP